MRKRHRNTAVLGAVLLPVAIICVLLFFTTALNNLSSGHTDESRRLLEESLHRAAATCYAADGCYPDTLEYLCSRAGIRIDSERFTVYYECFAQNVMPDITVLDIKNEEADD